MKVYTYIRMSMDNYEILDEVSYDYEGPIAKCGGDSGGGGETEAGTGNVSSGGGGGFGGIGGGGYGGGGGNTAGNPSFGGGSNTAANQNSSPSNSSSRGGGESSTAGNPSFGGGSNTAANQNASTGGRSPGGGGGSGRGAKERSERAGIMSDDAMGFEGGYTQDQRIDNALEATGVFEVDRDTRRDIARGNIMSSVARAVIPSAIKSFLGYFDPFGLVEDSYDEFGNIKSQMQEVSRLNAISDEEGWGSGTPSRGGGTPSRGDGNEAQDRLIPQSPASPATPQTPINSGTTDDDDRFSMTPLDMARGTARGYRNRFGYSQLRLANPTLPPILVLPQ